MSTNKPFHLFNIHNHIMYLVAKSAIKHEGLAPEDCAFVLTRNYMTPKDDDGIPRYDFPFPNWQLSFYYDDNYNQVRKNIEKFVSNVTKGRPFHYYVQTTLSYYVNIIASMNECVSYSFIEEGLTVYWEKSEINKRLMPLPENIDLDLMSKCNNMRLLTFDREYFNVTHPKFGRAHAAFPTAFPYVGRDKVVVLDNVFQKVYLPECQGADAIFMPSDERSLTKLPIVNYEKLFIWFVRHVLIPRGHKKILCKFRLETQAAKERPMFERVFKMFPDIKFVELPNDTVMENIIYTHDMPLYCLLTSAGGYGKMLNKKVYSLAKAYLGFDLGFYRYRYFNVISDMERLGVDFLLPNRRHKKILSLTARYILSTYLIRLSFVKRQHPRAFLF